MTQALTLPIDELVEGYREGVSLTKLAKTYGVSRSTITRKIKDAGVTLRPSGVDNRLHFFNENYFDKIDAPDKAYWLGFMFADGSVGTNRFDTQISLAIKDIGHLHKFLECLDYSGPGAVRTGV